MTLYELFVKLSADTRGFSGPMKDAQTQMGTFGTAATTLTAKLGTGLGLAAIGAAALSAARKFDEANVQIARSTGATGEKLDSLNQSFTAIYKSTSASSEAVASALSNIATRTGATGKALEDLTLQMIRLAKTQREDVAALTPLVTRVFGDWSIATYDQAAALKFLQAVSQQTGTQVSKLAETVVYAGAPLRMLGYNFEEAAVLIGKFEKEGVNTELVLGGMKAALQKFSKEGVKDVAAEWGKFVEGVKSGSITLQDVMLKVGAKRGPDLYRAIIEGRFEIDKMTEAAKKLAAEGGGSVETFTGQMKKLQHQLEAVVSEHKDLVLVAPMAVMALGTVAGGVKALIPLLQNAALGLAGIGAATVLAGITATGKAIDDLNAKYDSLIKRQKEGKEFIEPWTPAEGKGFSETLPIRLAKPTGPPSAPSEKELKEYAKALQEALELFGLSDKKATELNKSLGVLNKEFQAGRLTTEQYSAALTKYWQDLAKTVTVSAETTVAVLAQEKAQLSLSAAMDKIVSAVVRMQDASKPWGAQLEYHRTKLDELTTSLHGAYLELQAITTKQLEVDWSKVSKGTTLEVALDPNSSIGLRRAADAAADEAIRIRDLWQQGKATQRDWEIAQQRAEEAERRATGTTKEHSRAISAQASAAKEVDREVRRAFDNMARGIAKNIVEWKGWGETLKSVVKNLAEGLLEIFIRQLFKPLEDMIAGLGKSLTEKLTGKLTGTAESGATGGSGSGGGGGTGSGFGGDPVSAILGAFNLGFDTAAKVKFGSTEQNTGLTAYNTKILADQMVSVFVRQQVPSILTHLRDIYTVLEARLWDAVNFLATIAGKTGTAATSVVTDVSGIIGAIDGAVLKLLGAGGKDLSAWMTLLRADLFTLNNTAVEILLDLDRLVKGGGFNASVSLAPQLPSLPAAVQTMGGGSGTTIHEGDIYINGLDASGAPAEALELFRQGARLLRAKGVRSSVGIR